MRSSEEMALVLFKAFARYDGRKDVDELEWDDVTEWEQEAYKAEANAFMAYLFEHGRISAYLSSERLERYKTEYKAYLREKNV